MDLFVSSDRIQKFFDQRTTNKTSSVMPFTFNADPTPRTMGGWYGPKDQQNKILDKTSTG